MILDRRSLMLSLSVALASRVRGGALRARRSDPEAFLRAVKAGDLATVRGFLASDAGLAATRDAAGLSAYLHAHLAGHEELAGVLRATGLELDLVESVFAEDWARFERLAAEDPAGLHVAHPIGGTPLYGAALLGTNGFWHLRGAGCLSDEAPAGGTGFTPARGAMEHRTIAGAVLSASDLLGNGGDPNAAQRGGDSVLHGAVRRRSERLVRVVIRKGADVTARDARGRTPRDLAAELEWEAGVTLLDGHADLPRDHRASRFAYDAMGAAVERPDLSDVPQALQSQVTSASHMRLGEVRELVGRDERLVFSISTDDELAIEASAHTGNRALIRFHLEHGAPLSLPTAVALGDVDAIERLLKDDPRLVHERGAHDYPVMFYVALGEGGVDLARRLLEHGVGVDQESAGTTTLHWCVRRDDLELGEWLLAKGADVNAVGYRWDRHGETPLAVARREGRTAFAELLEGAGGRA